jgi:hypothetical protein
LVGGGPWDQPQTAGEKRHEPVKPGTPAAPAGGTTSGTVGGEMFGPVMRVRVA